MKKMFKVLFLCLISLGIMSCKMNEGISSSVNGGGTSDSYSYYKITVDFTQYPSITDIITEVHLIGEANGWDETNKDYVLTKQVDGTWAGTFDASKFRGKYFCVSYNDGGYGKTVRPVMGDDYSSYQGSATLVDKGVKVEGTEEAPPAPPTPAAVNEVTVSYVYKDSYLIIIKPNAVTEEINEIHMVGNLNGWDTGNKTHALEKQTNGSWTITIPRTSFPDSGDTYSYFKFAYNTDASNDWTKMITDTGDGAFRVGTN